MNRSIAFVSFLLILVAPLVRGQEMATDRPDQTEASNVIPVGRVQVETGVVYEREDVLFNTHAGLHRHEYEMFHYGTTLIRIGVFEWGEVRLAGEYSSTIITSVPLYETAFRPLDQRHGEIGGLAIGTKIALLREDGALPEIAFIGHLSVPTQGDGSSSKFGAPDFRFSLSHTLTEALSFGYNLGAEWEDISEPGAWIYTAALGVGISDAFGLYGEFFGRLPSGEPEEHTFDGGVTFLPMENLQLDASAGVGISDAAPDYYISAGVSFRLPR